jgi:hypothetical protein
LPLAHFLPVLERQSQDHHGHILDGELHQLIDRDGPGDVSLCE